MKYTVWRHKKTGNLYMILGMCIIEEMHTEAFRYVCLHDSQIEWIRPVGEFLDGRFERVEL